MCLSAGYRGGSVYWSRPGVIKSLCSWEGLEVRREEKRRTNLFVPSLSWQSSIVFQMNPTQQCKRIH